MLLLAPAQSYHPAATTVVVRERANGGAVADSTVVNVLLAATRLAGRTAS
jgi:hypothetical protein